MTIQPPLVARFYVVAFLVIWIAIITWTVIYSAGSEIGFGVLFTAFGVGLGYRLVRLGAFSASDGTLTIRNNLSTRTLKRSGIDDFRLSPNAHFGFVPQSILVLLRDGTAYGIDISRVTPRGKKRNAEQVAALRTWLRAGP